MNRNHANRPTPYTASDRARMKAADDAFMARMRRDIFVERVTVAVIVALTLLVFAAFFYTAEPDTYAAVVEREVIDSDLTLGDCMARIDGIHNASCELE